MTATAIKELKEEVKKHIDLADESTLKAVYSLLEDGRQEGWWDNISDGERDAIETGLKQMEEGKTTPHEEVMKKYSKWFGK
jgi:predicted transcriptional regulator